MCPVSSSVTQLANKSRTWPWYATFGKNVNLDIRASASLLAVAPFLIYRCVSVINRLVMSEKAHSEIKTKKTQSWLFILEASPLAQDVKRTTQSCRESTRHGAVSPPLLYSGCNCRGLQHFRVNILAASSSGASLPDQQSDRKEGWNAGDQGRPRVNPSAS